MTAQFAANLEAKLAAETGMSAPETGAETAAAPSAAAAPAPALSGGRLLWILLKGRLRALVRLLGFGRDS